MNTNRPFTIDRPDVEQVRADRVCASDTVWSENIIDPMVWEHGRVVNIFYTGEDVEIVFATKGDKRVTFETSRNNMVWISTRKD